MTEYLIFGTSYSKQPEEHIEWVVLARAENNKLAGAFLVSRHFVVDLIKTGSASFKTATIQNQKFLRGADVVIYDDEYLTTSPDASEQNNLENLPSFSMPDDEIETQLVPALEKIFG